VSRLRAGVAGAVAALAWAALEPVDRRVLRHDYSDVAMLGKAVTRTRAWPLAGLAVHTANGVAFGLVYGELNRRRRVSAVRLALVENTLLFPLAALVDRRHPARGERRLAPLFTPRGLVQATLRHAVFGAVLGLVAGEEAR
jgi:hypothetical protein